VAHLARWLWEWDCGCLFAITKMTITTNRNEPRAASCVSTATVSLSLCHAHAACHYHGRRGNWAHGSPHTHTTLLTLSPVTNCYSLAEAGFLFLIMFSR
jgi:hypothetical protein